MICSLRRYGLPRLSHLELNCGSGSGRVPKSAQVVVLGLLVESGWFSGTVSVVWLQCELMEILLMKSCVSSLLRGGCPLG